MTATPADLQLKRPAEVVHTGQPQRRPRSVFADDKGGSGPAVLWVLLGLVVLFFALFLYTATV